MKYLFVCFTALVVACNQAPKNESAQYDSSNISTLVKAPDTWIKDRSSKARVRMSESEAGQKLWSSIEAHGGLERWFTNGPIAFRFDYQPLDGGTRRDSYQTIDQWSSRAMHEVAANRELKYGWDGENAWSYPDTADVGINPRFWSTTPFYFVGLPFVLADEGTNYELLDPLEHDGVTYDLVKVTYDAGTGDAPDDFYVIYIHPETKLMGGLRYIVSYPGFFPDGGNAPEKFMDILGLQTVDGITVPTGYHTYWFKDGKPAEHITKIDVSDLSFKSDLEKGFFTIPAGAKIQDGLVPN